MRWAKSNVCIIPLLVKTTKHHLLLLTLYLFISLLLGEARDSLGVCSWLVILYMLRLVKEEFALPVATMAEEVSSWLCKSISCNCAQRETIRDAMRLNTYISIEGKGVKGRKALQTQCWQMGNPVGMLHVVSLNSALSLDFWSQMESWLCTLLIQQLSIGKGLNNTNPQEQ